jgi:hypothetical protein
MGYQMKLNPQGTLLVNSIRLVYDSESSDLLLELLQFDNRSGRLSNLITTPPVTMRSMSDWQNKGFATHLDFSPNGELLYTTGSPTGIRGLFQLKLRPFHKDSIINSIQTIVGTNLIQRLANVQEFHLGPDGRIYTKETIGDSLCVIESPNTRGIGCGFRKNVLPLRKEGVVRTGLTNAPGGVFVPFTADITADDTVLCNGKTTTLRASTKNAASYQWFKDGVAIPMADQDTIAVNEQGNYSLTLRNHYGCELTSQTIHIQLLDGKAKLFPDDTHYCINQAPVTLTATPAGGLFTGTGIIGTDTFDPATAGIGTHTIAYTANINNCSIQDTFYFAVHAANYPRIDGIPVYVNQNDAPYLIRPIPTGGTLLGPGVRAGLFHPNEAGVGEHMIFYSLQDFHCPTFCTYVVYVRPTVVPCPAPTLRIERTAGNLVILRWNTIPSATNYKLEYREQSTAGAPWLSINTPETTHSLRLLTGKTYAFRLQAICGATPSRTSNTVVQYISPVRFWFRQTDETEQLNTDKLLIYPNPSEGLFRLSYQNNSAHALSLAIKLCNISGAEVFNTDFTANTGENEFTIDATHLANGVYILYTTSAGRTSAHKVIKN